MEGLPSLPGYDRWKTSIPDSWDKPDMMDESDFYDMIRSADKEQGQEFVEWLKEYPDLYDSVIGTLESGEEENPFMVAINNGMDWKEICHEFFDIKPVKYYPGDINEGKKKAKLTESQLKEVIKDSVQKVMNEISSDMIGRASKKFHEKYGGTDFPGPDAKDFPKDKYGNLLYPKDMKPLADHYRNFRQAFNKRYEEEQLENPIVAKAQELYDEHYGDLEMEAVDRVDTYSWSVNLWMEVEDEDGKIWKFDGGGSASYAGGLELDEVDEMNFEAPDGTTGSVPKP